MDIKILIKKYVGCIRLHRDVDLEFCKNGCQYFKSMASPDEIVCSYCPKEFRDKILRKAREMKK